MTRSTCRAGSDAEAQADAQWFIDQVREGQQSAASQQAEGQPRNRDTTTMRRNRNNIGSWLASAAAAHAERRAQQLAAGGSDLGAFDPAGVNAQATAAQETAEALATASVIARSDALRIAADHESDNAATRTAPTSWTNPAAAPITHAQATGRACPQAASTAPPGNAHAQPN